MIVYEKKLLFSAPFVWLQAVRDLRSATVLPGQFVDKKSKAAHTKITVRIGKYAVHVFLIVAESTARAFSLRGHSQDGLREAELARGHENTVARINICL